jgi:uncharacterized protein YjbJ (UPF0337 family)
MSFRDAPGGDALKSRVRRRAGPRAEEELKQRVTGRPKRVALTSEGDPMSATDKIKNAAEDVTGKLKEAVGKGTDNERLEAEGKGDQVSSDFKQAGENVKDAFKH